MDPPANQEVCAIVAARGYAEAAAAVEAAMTLAPPPPLDRKCVVLKPNLTDLPRESRPAVTHPAIIAAVAEACWRRGAAAVWVADGPALQRDTLEIADVTGLLEALRDCRARFRDLHTEPVMERPNVGGLSRLPKLHLAALAAQADVLITVPKMKTHHWTGVSLGLKNMLGIASGCVYGWPRHVLHTSGLDAAIVDFGLLRMPDYSVVDGIVGMQGDGPILGDAVGSHVVVAGANVVAVDATCARLMGLEPRRISHLALAEALGLGPLASERIVTRGERLSDLSVEFQLLPHVQGLRS